MTATRLITAAEFWQMPDHGGRNELIEGELHPMSPTGSHHGKVALKVGARLLRYVESQKLGEVLAAETGFRLTADPDTVLAPDASFVCAARISPEGLSAGYFDGAPDLAAEVLSPSDSWQTIERKAKLYLAHGTRLVWILNPQTLSITVFRPGPRTEYLKHGDTITGDDVLPGFACPVAEFFA